MQLERSLRLEDEAERTRADRDACVAARDRLEREQTSALRQLQLQATQNEMTRRTLERARQDVVRQATLIRAERDAFEQEVTIFYKEQRWQTKIHKLSFVIVPKVQNNATQWFFFIVPIFPLFSSPWRPFFFSGFESSCHGFSDSLICSGFTRSMNGTLESTQFDIRYLARGFFLFFLLFILFFLATSQFSFPPLSFSSINKGIKTIRKCEWFFRTSCWRRNSGSEKASLGKSVDVARKAKPLWPTKPSFWDTLLGIYEPLRYTQPPVVDAEDVPFVYTPNELLPRSTIFGMSKFSKISIVKNQTTFIFHIFFMLIYGFHLQWKIIQMPSSAAPRFTHLVTPEHTDLVSGIKNELASRSWH